MCLCMTHRLYDWAIDAESATQCMSPCMVVCTLHYVWLRVKGRAGSNAEATSQEMKPHFTAPTNKVWDHFCRRKWFGVSECESIPECPCLCLRVIWKKMSILQSPAFSLIIRFGAEMFGWDIFRPWAQGALWLDMFISSNARWTAHWASLHCGHQCSKHLLGVLQLFGVLVILLITKLSIIL